MEPTHVHLDILGLIPLFGEVADAVNGVLYTIEGDGVNATISYGAALPFGGWISTSGKYAVIATKHNGKVAAMSLKLVGNLVDFGDSGALRQIIGAGANEHAHHLLAWNLRNHPVIQSAAKNTNSSKVFHMNHPKNGLAVASWRNSNHPAYNDRIEAGLNEIKDKYPNGGSADVYFDELTKFEDYLRDLINANPTKKIQDIEFTYIP